MPEETPDDTPEEADVEAEMLRMMQEEAEGGEDAGEETAEGESGDEANVDDMLEQEMLRAMQEGGEDEAPGAPSGESGLAPFLSQMAGGSDDEEGIERLSEVDVTVTVELGGNHIPIKDILEWTRDSVVELEPEEHEPLNVLVNGKLFARGEMVVVGDTFGVRIIELVDQPEDAHF